MAARTPFKRCHAFHCCNSTDILHNVAAGCPLLPSPGSMSICKFLHFSQFQIDARWDAPELVTRILGLQIYSQMMVRIQKYLSGAIVTSVRGRGSRSCTFNHHTSQDTCQASLGRTSGPENMGRQSKSTGAGRCSKTLSPMLALALMLHISNSFTISSYSLLKISHAVTCLTSMSSS